MKNTFAQTRLYIDKKHSRSSSVLFFVGLFIFAAFISVGSAVKATAQTTGEWTAHTGSDKSGSLDIVFTRRIMNPTNTYQTNRYVAFSELQNLTPQAVSSGSLGVNFKLAREAGAFEFEGLFKDGKGAGGWNLTPNQNFVEAMRGCGYDNLTIYDLFSAAVSDLTQKYVEDLKSAGYGNLKFGIILLLKSNDITADFIRRAKAKGFTDLTWERLVELRSQNVVK
jgi:hypothetical protein